MSEHINTPGLFDQQPAYQLPAGTIPVPDGVDHRPIRGMEIAAVARIDRDGNYYLVPSQSGQPRYKVWYNEQQPSCNCPDFENRGCKCKHIWAVEYTLKRETVVAVDPKGNATVTETVTVTKKQIVGLLVLFVVTLRVILRGDKTPNELPPVRHQEPRGFPLD